MSVGPTHPAVCDATCTVFVTQCPVDTAADELRRRQNGQQRGRIDGRGFATGFPAVDSHRRVTSVISFDFFHLRTRIVSGPGCIARLGELTSELGTDESWWSAIRASLPPGMRSGDLMPSSRRESRPTCSAMYSKTPRRTTWSKACGWHNDSSRSNRGSGRRQLNQGLHKGINFIFSNGGRMQDYWGVGKALRPMLPMVAVPTTSGTGSETQSFALISDSNPHEDGLR